MPDGSDVRKSAVQVRAGRWRASIDTGGGHTEGVVTRGRIGEEGVGVEVGNTRVSPFHVTEIGGGESWKNQFQSTWIPQDRVTRDQCRVPCSRGRLRKIYPGTTLDGLVVGEGHVTEIHGGLIERCSDASAMRGGEVVGDDGSGNGDGSSIDSDTSPVPGNTMANGTSRYDCGTQIEGDGSTDQGGIVFNENAVVDLNR